MALKDIDPSKFKSFTYPPAPNPQSFQSNGETITGQKTPIEKRYINSGKTNSFDEATTSDDFVGNLNTPQTFQIENKAGTTIVTGLKGIINSDLDILKSKSLIIKTYDEMLSDDEGLFPSFSYNRHNPTFGYQQSPFVLKDFGASSLASQPERFADPQIRGHISLTRGGAFTDAMVDDQINLLNNTGVLGNFKTNQLLLQSEAIMKGNVLSAGGLNLMSLHNTLEFDQNFIPGVRVYRHGFITSEVQRYSDHTPLIKSGILDLGGTIDPTKYTSDDLNFTPKLGYLYNKFILSPDAIESSQGFSFSGLVDNVLSSMMSDPYPIIPSINVVKSPSLNYNTGNTVYSAETMYESQEKTTLEQGDTYKFFSKFSNTVFKTTPYQNDEGEEGHPESKIASTREYNDWMDSDLPRPLEQKIREKTFAGAPKIPKAVEGINEYDGGSSLSYQTLGADDNGNVDPGGANSLRYEDTLRSSSELNQTIKAELGGLGGDRNEALLVQSGPEGDKYFDDNRGARDHYKKKVYAIGRQGLIGVTATEDGEVFRGTVKMASTNGMKSYRSDQADKVNMIPYGGRIVDNPTEGQKADEIHASAEELDFVPLVFKDVYNKKAIAFRAILGDITDTVTPQWTENKYIGRATTTANYSGVTRQIGFDFKIYPKTKQEFPVILEKVNYLVGQCYPNLDTNLRQTGPIIQLTLGDILNKQLGYLESVTISFPSDSTWELDPGLRFTKLINVSVTFNHIGGYVPVATGKHYGLPWLRGESYDNNGAAFNNFPNRQGTESENTSGALNNYKELFKDLGQG